MSRSTPQSVADIDWKTWVPEQRATLLFVIQDGQILLIYKKRGLGAGNINGPGGRLEDGETPLQAAIRETEEELLITPEGVTEHGKLFFQFTAGLSIFCSVFRASGYSGTPRETDEAIPHWFALDEIPYERMWQDDITWLPLLIQGKAFKGYYLFDDNLMIDHRVDVSA
jgi:8-oxo-dGTP diphosphatase